MQLHEEIFFVTCNSIRLPLIKMLSKKKQQQKKLFEATMLGFNGRDTFFFHGTFLLHFNL